MTLTLDLPQFPLRAFTNATRSHQPTHTVYPDRFTIEMRRGSVFFTASFDGGRGGCETPMVAAFEFPVDIEQLDADTYVVKGLDLSLANVQINKHEDLDDIELLAGFSAERTPEDSPMHEAANGFVPTEISNIDELHSNTRLTPAMTQGIMRHFYYAQNHLFVGMENEGDVEPNDLVNALLKQNPDELRKVFTALAVGASDLSRRPLDAVAGLHRMLTPTGIPTGEISSLIGLVY